MNNLTRVATIRAEVNCPRVIRENMWIAAICGSIIGIMLGFSV